MSQLVAFANFSKILLLLFYLNSLTQLLNYNNNDNLHIFVACSAHSNKPIATDNNHEQLLYHRIIRTATSNNHPNHNNEEQDYVISNINNDNNAARTSKNNTENFNGASSLSLYSPPPIENNQLANNNNNNIRAPQVINTNKQNEVIVGAGSNVSLACSARGTPPLTFVWFQDEKNLTTGRPNASEPPASTKLLEEKRYEIAEELGLPGQPNVTTSILYLFNLKLTDTSLFLCWVENTAGYTIANFSLVVNDSPPAPLPGSIAPTSSFWNSLGLSPGEQQMGVISIVFVVILLAAIFLLLFVKHSTSRSSSKSSQSSADLKKPKSKHDISHPIPTKSNHLVAPIASISGANKFGNMGNGTTNHNRSVLTDSDLDDDDNDTSDDRSSSGSASYRNNSTKVLASGELDGFIEHMRSGIINMDYHSMSPVIQFNNTLKNNNNNNNNISSRNATSSQQQQSYHHLDGGASRNLSAINHFPSASNASSAPYYGGPANGSMATTTSDLSPGSGSVNANFANTISPSTQHQPPISNCDLQHHMTAGGEMAPATTSYTSGYGENHINQQQHIHHLSHHHHLHHLNSQQQQQRQMVPPPYSDPHLQYHRQQQQHMYNGGPLVIGANGAPIGQNMRPPSMVGHPMQQQQGDLVLQHMVQIMPQANQQRLRSEDQFHQIL